LVSLCVFLRQPPGQEMRVADKALESAQAVADALGMSAFQFSSVLFCLLPIVF